MATIAFSTVGTVFGGPIGGAIGALVGRQVDGALFGIPNRRGPRLKDLNVTTSTYGEAIPRHYGRMRVSGTIIWATELIEHSETRGGGKGSPSVTAYSYTASFAVALASRPINGIGRIWADGKLLRGVAGVLKTGGSLRIYTGAGDQPADPLLAADASPERCPAYRGLAYVVFEDLDLADFFNRVPNLTFEILADDAVDLGSLVGDVIDGIDANVSLDGIAGISCEGPVAELLGAIDAVMPIDAHASGQEVVITAARLQDEPIPLPDPAVSVDDGVFGAQTGYARMRAPVVDRPPMALRYYDTDRDYLPGVQRAATMAGPGEPETLELPAAIDAASARALIERTLRRADWSRDRMAWRTAELDGRIGPGSAVALPDVDGIWRVADWEWRNGGVDLSLTRIFPENEALALPHGPADPGQFNAPVDAAASVTAIAAFELPRLSIPASGEGPTLFAAVSSVSANWSGAALFGDAGNGELVPLGSSGRARSVIGEALDALPAGSPHVLDRTSQVLVQLVAPDFVLADASIEQLARGGNLALLGEELIQFARATSVGSGQWRLTGLLRGRAGTEFAIGSHVAGDRFALVDGRAIAVDPLVVGSSPDAGVHALGRADIAPVGALFGARGVSLRPPCPVHPARDVLADGTWRLSWVRRARGAWAWQDGVEVPLGEDRELYLITCGPLEGPHRTWQTDVPRLDLAPPVVADLQASFPGAAIDVRQHGTQALSRPLRLIDFI